MKIARIVGAVFLLAGVAGVVFGVARGLSFPYVMGGAALLIGVLALVRSFGSTRSRRWVAALSALVVLAGLIAAPGLLNASRYPVVDYAARDAVWVSDGDGGGYALDSGSVTRLDDSADTDWERTLLAGTWSTPDGLVTADDDRVRFVTSEGETAWEFSTTDLGGTDLDPVAWHDGVTTIAACDVDFDAGSWWPCSFVGIDATGAETYRVEAEYRPTVYAGGSYAFLNTDRYVVPGDLPAHFGYAVPGDPAGDQADVVVADASNGDTVTTVSRAEGTVPPAFAGDRVLTAVQAGERCSLSSVPLGGEQGWTTDIPCTGTSEYARPFLDSSVLDGDLLVWRPDDNWSDDDVRPDDVAIDLGTGESTPVGLVHWGDLGAKQTGSSSLLAGGALVEVDDGTLSARDPFAEKPDWATALHGTFRSVSASSHVLAVVTKPFTPRLFASDEELQLEVYSLDDGRLLGAQHFVPDDARDILALDDAALLVLKDGTSIRVG